MPFGSNDLSHLPVQLRFSAGPTTGLFENIEASFRRQHIVDAALGFQIDLRTRASRNIERLQELGVDVELPAVDAFDVAAARELGLVRGTTGAFSVLPSGLRQEYLTEIDKLDAQVLELRGAGQAFGVGQELQTFREMFNTEVARRRKVVKETEGVQARSSALGVFGNLIGSVAGSVDPFRDPLLVASIFLPVLGKTWAIRLLWEGTLGGGTEIAQQFLFVRPRAEALGEPTVNPLVAAMFGAVGAAGFRGVLEGAGPLYRQLEKVVSPQTSAARLISEEIERNLGRGPDFSVLRMSDRELLAAVQKLPRTTDTTVAEALLTRDIISAETSPYPATRQGRILTEQELLDAMAEFEGVPQASTAIGRLLPPSDLQVRGETPSEVFARAEAPEAFARLDELTAEIGELRQVIAEGEAVGPSAARTVGDVVAETDVELGGRIKAAERRLAEAATPVERRAAAEALDELIPAERHAELTRAAQEGGFAVRQRVGEAREALRPLLREQKELRRDVKRLGDRLVGESQRAGAVTAARGRAADMDRMVDAFDSEKHVDEIVERAQASLREGAGEGVEVAEGMVDIGGDDLIPANRLILTEDGDLTVRQILDDLADDDALVVEAGRCGLS